MGKRSKSENNLPRSHIQGGESGLSPEIWLQSFDFEPSAILLV